MVAGETEGGVGDGEMEGRVGCARTRSRRHFLRQSLKATPRRTAERLEREAEAEHETDGAPVDAAPRRRRSAAATATAQHRQPPMRKRRPLQAADEWHWPTQDTFPYTSDSIPRPHRLKGRAVRRLPARRPPAASCACYTADWSSSRLVLRACRTDEHPGRMPRTGRARGRCAWTLPRRGRRRRPPCDRARRALEGAATSALA